MSEAFDPEKRERYQGFLAEQPDTSGDEMWVLASDYDKLLALYRHACALDTPEGQYIKSL